MMPKPELTPAIVHRDLHQHAEATYRSFNLKLLPTVDPDCLLGVRVPQVRALAKGYLRAYDCEPYIARPAHRYFEEQLLHGCIIGQTKDPEVAQAHIQAYLPHLDNWATCDSFAPVAISRQADFFYPHLLEWLSNPHEYTVRFALVMLMKHYLKGPLQPGLLSTIAELKRPEYYVRMGQAWFWAEALTHQWDEAVAHIPQLEEWVRRKAIQKARESWRIPDERKAHLRQYR
ncbi:MAG: DNA alkylation repair protein [Bacteroidia bacterium]|nr:MAG: DNA alkylation repair protein [Bacteroidia bacterium]